MRDDFSEATKRILALRAGYRCSFTNCRRLTSGPSTESASAVASIGVAAHISAASSGGKRYLETMAPAERTDIENGIWLCEDHAKLIDRDAALYTINALKEMKRRHEEWCASEVRGSSNASLTYSDLIAVGPDIVFMGELSSIEEGRWSFQITHQVIGDIHSFASFVDNFAQCPQYDRYLVANALGDGRALASAPSFEKTNEGHFIRCPIKQRAKRIRADQLPTDLKFSGDLSLNSKGDIATVSGLDSLPQKIELGLGVQRGELLFHRDFGARLSEYYRLLRGSVWLERVFKLEVARLAAIPYADPPWGEHTPLLCVDRVLNVTAEPELDGRVPVSVELEVHGLGPWRHNLTIHVG